MKKVIKKVVFELNKVVDFFISNMKFLILK